MSIYDCIVVGSGHAGSCAALSAVDNGCQKVLIVDKCPKNWVGGNGYFTAGAFRTVHAGLDDLLPIVRNVTPDVAGRIDMGPYTTEEFTADIMRLGDGRSDPVLVRSVVGNSRRTIGWLASRVGMPFNFSFHRQAYEVDGRQKFWGGIVLCVEDGGKGLIAIHQKALQKAGVEVWFDSPMVGLTLNNDTITGIAIEKNGQRSELRARSVVLAAGGFEASTSLRVKHLGPSWEKAKIRGTPYNTGDGFSVAKAVGAKLTGDWQGCHSTVWDANAAANAGDRIMSNQLTKSGYPLGVMINAAGERFVDEGEDFRNYTYAKFGRAVLSQKGGYAFQVWDSKVIHWLRREEYGDGVVEKIFADSVEALAEKLVAKGLESKETFLQTLSAFNVAALHHREAHPDRTWDPAIRDGLSTGSSNTSLTIPKSNWALPINNPPYMAVKVEGAITFTFGGLAIDPETAGVLSVSGEKIPGLFCTGEMVGGLFYGNYPGGSGLMAGAVFGRKAGFGASKMACHDGLPNVP